MSKHRLKVGVPVRAVYARIDGRPVGVEQVPQNGTDDRTRVAQAYAQGLAEGKKAGSQEVWAQVHELYQQLQTVVSQVVAEQQRLVREAEPALVKLVIAVVRRLLRRELNQNGHYVEAMVREALRMVHDSARVVIRLHPDDSALLRDKAQELGAEIADLEVLEFKDDPHITRGGCIVETDLGTIDARLEVQLEEISHELEESLIGQS
ncbi:MAG: FliH/SctL family protein [candidate division KSB1 bacterium]|nr:FliH/SctL family protein [candidate division KSB1 bacterium]